MKRAPLLLILFCFSTILCSAQAETDTIYSVNNWQTNGITQIATVNPNTGQVLGATTSYATGDGTTSSAALTLNRAGTYAYYIPYQPNQGEFSVYSIPTYPTATTTTAPTTGTQVLGPNDVSGAATTNVFFRRLAIRADGWAYMISSEEGTGKIYMSRFLTAPDGSASSFQNLGTVTLDGSTNTLNFYNGDIAFDSLGNVFALVNQNEIGGITRVYTISASDLAAATTSTSVTDMKFKYEIYKTGTTPFEGVITGIAFSRTGNLYFSIQGSDGGIYFFNRSTGDPNSGDIVISGPISTANSGAIADLATNYFPVKTVLPVTYGDIKTKIFGGSLMVDWSTLSESNNSHFDIEVSSDGKTFRKVGTIKSKANNGNSDKTLQYQFSLSLSNSGTLLGISILSLSVLLLLFNRRNKFLLSLMMLVGLGITITSCSKTGEQVDIDTDGKLYVRIVQYDIDGKSRATRTYTAYKAD